MPAKEDTKGSELCLEEPKPRKASCIDALGFLALHGPQPKASFIEATEKGLLTFMVEKSLVTVEKEMVFITQRGIAIL